MNVKTEKKSRAALMALDAALSIAALLMALQILDGVSPDITELEQLNYSATFVSAAALFFILAASELVRFFTRRDKTKFSAIRHITGTLLFAASAVLLLVRRGDVLSAYIACMVYTVMIVLGRVERMVRVRRARSIVLNVLLSVLIVVLLILPTNVLLVPLLTVIQFLIHIGGMAFARMNFSVLKKIIRKTYIVEFLCGMLLLIVAFSIVLQKTEPSIETFMDGLWYCFAIVTTIGFGDYTAISAEGRLLSVILGIYGIIVVALITSVIVNFYNEVKDEPDGTQPLPPPNEAPPEAERETKEETL